MADSLIVSPANCRGRAWREPQGVAFAGEMALVPIHGAELAKAAASGPLAFAQRDGHWELVAICGLEPNTNLFVRNGEWLGLKMPDWLSAYPFYTRTQGEGESKRQVLAFDTRSGMLVDSADDGEPFFDDNDQLMPGVAARLEHIKRYQQHQAQARRAVKMVVDAEVIAPWPDALKQQTGITLDGLYMLDERALAKLDDAGFAALRRALPLAYATNFSLQQCHILHRLAKLNPPVDAAGVDVEQLFDDEDETFNFDF